MNVTRQNLIDICDQFLAGQIDKIFIQDFAWNAICDDNFTWDEDEIISDTIFEWDNEDINYEINKTNIQLWRKKLISEIDDLQIYNDWNSHISKQKEICGKYGSQWKPIDKKLKIGISESLDNQPIHGLRHPKENGTTGWSFGREIILSEMISLNLSVLNIYYKENQRLLSIWDLTLDIDFGLMITVMKIFCWTNN